MVLHDLLVEGDGYLDESVLDIEDFLAIGGDDLDGAIASFLRDLQVLEDSHQREVPWDADSLKESFLRLGIRHSAILMNALYPKLLKKEE